jgi:hypothetical protein
VLIICLGGNKMLEIRNLLEFKSVIIGVRRVCGKSTDPTVKNFNSFEQEIKKLEKQGMIIAKISRNARTYDTTKAGGIWNEYEYRLIDDVLLTPNVRLICQAKYKIINTKIPLPVKKELQQAIKNGILFHIKKDGLAKECYYFLGCAALARSALCVDAENASNAINAVLC